VYAAGVPRLVSQVLSFIKVCCAVQISLLSRVSTIEISKYQDPMLNVEPFSVNENLPIPQIHRFLVAVIVGTRAQRDPSFELGGEHSV